mmetsp:Transcript_42244/g.99192  ORF Transcript_42244/g.99192 Transcript_42244/m.99192 type:complete len:214 (-) Transcript_42244:1071-1712(-)
MRNRAVLAELAVPPILFLGKVHLLHACIQSVQALLSLGAADNFTNPRCENIHCSDCFAILIHAHVECFDILGIVVDNDSTFELLLREPAFVFCLQVCAPNRFVLKLCAILVSLLQHLYCISVADAGIRLRGGELLQSLPYLLVNTQREEIQIRRTRLKHCSSTILEVVLCALHVIFNVSKSHLWLNHPKLRKMPGCVGGFGTESGSESVNISE